MRLKAFLCFSSPPPRPLHCPVSSSVGPLVVARRLLVWLPLGLPLNKYFVLHYSSLHSINKAIDQGPLPPLTPPFAMPAAVVFLVAFPQNAFNSILFQFNCHIANCLACLPAYCIYGSLPACLPAYLSRSVRCVDWAAGSKREQGVGSRVQGAGSIHCALWQARLTELIILPALSILYNIFALIYVLDSVGFSNGFRVLRLEFSMNFP